MSSCVHACFVGDVDDGSTAVQRRIHVSLYDAELFSVA